MDPESKKLLEETFQLVSDNNKILHGIRRSQRIASFMRALYWLIIIGISIGSFYYISPYLDKILGLYNSLSDTEQKLNSSSGSIQDLLKNFSN